MKTLLIRAASALIAVLFVGLFVYYGGTEGMRLLTLIAVLLAIREGSRILFPQAPFALRQLFSVLCVTLFLCGVYRLDQLALALAVSIVFLLSVSLLSHKQFTDLSEMSRFQSNAIMGFVYLALMPVFATQLLDLENGLIWYLALMGFVFASDTTAYLAGWRLGRHLLMPAVSPKKTIEGSLGGIVGSCLSALIFHFFLPHVAIPPLLALAVVVGMTGQMGDLFESMLKRVANQKDSGSLMPGHGGVLDRIDGVLFAAPVMWAGASLLEKWF